MDNLEQNMTEEALMTEIKNGNLDLASELYDIYSKRLYNYFVKLSQDKETGYDMMQDTFLRMIKYRHTYKDGKSFKTWIFQISRNVFKDYYKKHKMMYTSYSDINQIQNELHFGEDISELEHQKLLLHKSMLRLPEESREILVLSRFKDMKYQEIADILNLSVSHVKVKVFRAIKKLREYYFELDKV
jgi:RNA polymerase sigma-70 factor (ECF subfamily)